MSWQIQPGEVTLAASVAQTPRSGPRVVISNNCGTGCLKPAGRRPLFVTCG